MCYTCGPVVETVYPGFSIVYTRVADEWTQASDFDCGIAEQQSFLAGEWAFVGLCATLLVNNRPVATQAVYGIRECPEFPCALDAAEANAWVTAEVLDTATARGHIGVGLPLL